MKTYEIKLIKAQLVADIAKSIEYTLESQKENIKSNMVYYEERTDEYAKQRYQEELLKSDLISKIKITIDGIEL